MPNFLPLIIISILSILGVFVLSKFSENRAKVKSDGRSKMYPKGKMKPFAKVLEIIFEIINPSMKLSGNIGKFVIIFGLLTNFFFYYNLAQNEPQYWTIIGSITKDDQSSYDGITVDYQPPSPILASILVNGQFYMYRVEVIEKYGWPKLLFSCNGYYPEEYEIDEKTDVINRGGKVIKLKNKIALRRSLNP